MEAPYGNDASAIAVLSNTTVACDATADDDPATTRDESAEAQAWWADSVEAAVAREGSVVVLLFLANASGEYALGPTTHPAAAYRVEESSWDADGRHVDEYEVSAARAGSATVEAGDDVRLSFEFGAWAAAASLDRCDNDRLVNGVLGLYYAM